jgi:two-component system NtrC family sensor kinase
MPSPATPKNEKSRLRLLHELGVLDTFHEDLPDAIVVAAASLANTPIAAITLVDEHRQWFKGSVGLDMRETRRALSFCAHTILTPHRQLIVKDARDDSRFSDNEFVTSDPGVRFYAGFPLLVAGHAIGALCVVDDMPRGLSADQIARLQGLASGTAAWLELSANAFQQ